MNYQYLPQYRVNRNVPAETVGAELDKINKRDGIVRPEVVVDEATPKDSPLHPCFEWSVQKAAHQYRLSQARHLIKAVVYVEKDVGPERRYAYVPESQFGGPGGKGGGYKPIRAIVTNEDEFHRTLTFIEDRIADLQRSSLQLKEIAQREAGTGGTPDLESRIKLVTMFVEHMKAAKGVVQMMH